MTDRFRTWRDFAVRLRGAAATAALADALEGGDASSPGAMPNSASLQGQLRGAAVSLAVNSPTAFCPFAFALRAALPGRFEVAGALRAFFSDSSMRRYTVAAAYLDMSGAALLQLALARGADVTLIMPSAPNVYTHANAAVLCRLLQGGGVTPRSGSHQQQVGRLTAVMHPAMVHAKAAVGFRPDGSAAAIIGSANLKERSLTQFGELVMRCEGGAFCARLAAALARLASEATPVGTTPPAEHLAMAPRMMQERAASAAEARALLHHSPLIAAVEEWLG